MAYATITDLTNIGMNANTQKGLTSTQISGALQDASDYADTFFRARWGSATVPLIAWDTAVTQAVAKIAAYRLIMIRGLNPASTADQRFKTDYDDAVAWLDKVQRQQAHPLVTLALNASPQIQPSLTTFSVVATATGCTARNRGW